MTADPQSPYQPLCALAYKSSKAALNMATLLFAQELAGTSIKVNAASPGVVSTDSAVNFIGPAMARQTPFISPEQAARVVVMLATLPADDPPASSTMPTPVSCRGERLGTAFACQLRSLTLCPDRPRG